jgi:hypothetical protein
MTLTDEEFEKIVKDVRDDGYEVDRPIKEAHGWTTGTRARVIEDDIPNAVFQDDEGIVVCEEGEAAQIVTLAIPSFSVTVLVDPTNIEEIS